MLVYSIEDAQDEDANAEEGNIMRTYHRLLTKLIDEGIVEEDDNEVPVYRRKYFVQPLCITEPRWCLQDKVNRLANAQHRQKMTRRTMPI